MARITGQDESDELVARGRTVDDDERVDRTAILAEVRASSRLPRGPAHTSCTR